MVLIYVVLSGVIPVSGKNLESGDTLGFRQKFITPVQSVAARADAGIGWGERAPRVGQPGRRSEGIAAWEAFRGNSSLGGVPRVEQPGRRSEGGGAWEGTPERMEKRRFPNLGEAATVRPFYELECCNVPRPKY